MFKPYVTVTEWKLNIWKLLGLNSNERQEAQDYGKWFWTTRVRNIKKTKHIPSCLPLSYTLKVVTRDGSLSSEGCQLGTQLDEIQYGENGGNYGFKVISLFIKGPT